MSWLARSIADSLRIDDDNYDHEALSPSNRRVENPLREPAKEEEKEPNTDVGDLRGVKEDLSEFRESLTRQLWGVASFLAPPSSAYDPRVMSESTRLESVSSDEHDDHADDEDDQRTSRNGEGSMSSDNAGVVKNYGLRNVDDDYEDGEDYDEGNEDDDDWMRDVAGLTEEVLAFAGNVAHHPETWLDFPVEDEEDFDDFPMSESQKRHTQAVEHLSPRLAALRVELCPAHMSVGFFWKVYFVLLHSRLNKQDAELLSTPEVVEARAKWMQEQQKRAKKDSETYHGGHYGSADFDEDFTPRSLLNEHSETLSSWTFASGPATSSTTADSDTEKQIVNSEMQYTDKSNFDEKPSSLETNGNNEFAAPIYRRPVLHFDDDDDDYEWPEDECLVQNGKVIPVGIDEDISFSDLEDDDCCIPVISKPEFRL